MSYLLNHSAAHLRDCGVCGKHLERAESLKLHLKVHRESSFRCSVCGQSFTLRGNLRTHMRIHSGERPYACTVCGKSFGRRATLVRHVRSHTGEKPFTCTYCGHGFVEKGNLTVHLRTHTGERPYWCSVCDRRFSQLTSDLQSKTCFTKQSNTPTAGPVEAAADLPAGRRRRSVTHPPHTSDTMTDPQLEKTHFISGTRCFYPR
uniref:C2H2-type domain-containing protein n=1 Tax=Stegastes partitus TaxID=144197 RepID=A0A3B5B8X9_9TELE